LSFFTPQKKNEFKVPYTHCGVQGQGLDGMHDYIEQAEERSGWRGCPWSRFICTVMVI